MKLLTSKVLVSNTEQSKSKHCSTLPAPIPIPYTNMEGETQLKLKVVCCAGEWSPIPSPQNASLCPVRPSTQNIWGCSGWWGLGEISRIYLRFPSSSPHLLVPRTSISWARVSVKTGSYSVVSDKLSFLFPTASTCLSLQIAELGCWFCYILPHRKCREPRSPCLLALCKQMGERLHLLTCFTQFSWLTCLCLMGRHSSPCLRNLIIPV